MMTLMVRLAVGRPNGAVLAAATSLAALHGAHVIGIAVAQPLPILADGVYLATDAIAQDRRLLDAEIEAARAAFRQAFAGKGAAREWRVAVTLDSLSGYVAEQARAADWLITGGPSRDNTLDAARHVDAGDLAMLAGRPVLVVPEGLDRPVFSRVLIAWKDTRESRRAVLQAVPALRRAEHVVIAAIAPAGNLPVVRKALQEVAAWLARHGLSATPIALAADKSSTIHQQIDALAAAEGVGLVVAGAYGHSRFREWALGGVTRDLLRGDARCVLVSH